MSENNVPVLDKSERNIASYTPVTKEEGLFNENIGALHLLYFYFNGMHKNNELSILNNIGSFKCDLERIRNDPNIPDTDIKQYLSSEEFNQHADSIDKLLLGYLSFLEMMLKDHKKHVSLKGCTLYEQIFFKEVNYVTKRLDNFRNRIIKLVNGAIDGNRIFDESKQLESIFIKIKTIISNDDSVYTSEELEVS